MCPEFEMIDRQVTNDVSLFEAQIPFNPPQGKLIIDPKRAVKKFRRSAAGNYELAEDLRPPEVLLATTVYLMKEVLGDERWPANNVPFAVLYAFIRDRLRAIRTDLTLQNCKNLSSIRIHELSIRFLIAAGHLLCEEERAAFEPQQNNEQLNGCLSALREMYKTVRLTQPNNSENLLKYEAEFQAYSIILSVDKKEAAVAISALPVDLLKSEAIQVALEAYSAFQQTNYIKFLNLIGADCRTSYLQACLLHQFMLPVRQRGLTAMVSLPGEPFKTIPTGDFINWFRFVDEDELFYYSDRFGFKIYNGLVDLSALINRGEAFDLKAEEENFKIRKFQLLIEEQRRGGASLSEKMFEAMDLDVLRVLKVLEDSTQVGTKLTSEFLAASSSPLPKKDAVKKFFTASKLSQSDESFKSSEVFKKPSGVISNDIFPPTLQIPSVPTVPAVPVIDHQAILKKKLEAQAQERQLRREKIEAVSEGMLSALIDSIVGFQVSESCTVAWEHLYQEGREKRRELLEVLSKNIFEDILRTEILPKVLDVELMRIRCKAVETLTTKSNIASQVNCAILNELEREIYEETVLESFLDFKGRKFYKKCWFSRLRKRRATKFEFSMLKIPKEVPIHLVFMGSSNSHLLLDPLIKSKPPNTLVYLQSFLKPGCGLKMICSSGCFIVSHMEMTAKVNLFNWPANYPGPTIILTESDFEINTSEFPWQPEIINTGNRYLFELLDYAINRSTVVNLPVLNQNLCVSQFIPKEFLESFINENFEEEDEMILGLLERIVWILFKCPSASRLLSWHPLTAGRSTVIESLRKSQNIPKTFLNLFKASKSIEMTLNSMDQIYGNIFCANVENLYTNQSISELVRTRNEILKNKRVKTDHKQPQEDNRSFEGLREKLKMETEESKAYEQFLKKFL